LLLAIGDGLLTIVHVSIVLGNLLLWIPSALRRWHLWLAAATCASWYGLGLLYGMGYCLLTDWQWKLRAARGVPVAPRSFIHYLLVDGFGLRLTQSTVNTLTVMTFACVAILSVALNLRDFYHRRRDRARGNA
jgi:hypothetical protein